VRASWVDLYLLDLARNGLHALAVEASGVARQDVQALKAKDRDFADEAEAALEYYRDRTEWESLELGRVRGNPLPYFARLKAERPARYVEKSIVANVDLTPGLGTDADNRAFLARMIASATETTRQQLDELGAPPVVVIEAQAQPPGDEGPPA
jgi:hypothetical protein